MTKFLKQYFPLLLILAVGAFFRFYNLNWDEGFHLHPDERFLTMVGNAMKIPNSFGQYLDPTTSPMNPANINFKFFVYGVFPLIFNKFLAVFWGNDNYNAFTLQGRFLSGLFDLFVIILIFKTVKLLEFKYNIPHQIKYWASLLYAITVLPIQLSHFFAVDTFLNFFMFASFYFSLMYYVKKNPLYVFLSAVFFGCAFASKITAIYILPLNFIFLFPLEKIHFHSLKIHKKFIKEFFLIPLSLIIVYAITAYLIVRLADPYLFQTGNFLDLRLNTTFLENLKTLKYFENPNVWYPPAVQWVHKPPIIFALFNLIFFGVGAPYFLAVVIGMYFVFLKYRKFALIIFIFWVILFFLYQSTQTFKTMRYFIFLYPFFAILTGVGFFSLTQKSIVYKIILLFLIFIWPFMYFSIYTQKQSRVTASEWIFQNIPHESVLLYEHWDDPLPLQVTNTYGKTFSGEQLPVFDADTPEKWERINMLLQRGDYLILSSNRGWGSIPTVPEKYPRMTKFYRDLFEGKTQYKKIKEFTIYPSLKYLGIPLEIPDGIAEESFTVYDHPKVLIFKNIHE